MEKGGQRDPLHPGRSQPAVAPFTFLPGASETRPYSLWWPPHPASSGVLRGSCKDSGPPAPSPAQEAAPDPGAPQDAQAEELGQTWLWGSF